MWPAVPRIMRGVLPSTIFPELECLEWAAVAQMFREELAQQALVRGGGGLVGGGRVVAIEKRATRVARVGWQKPPRRCGAAASLAERSSGGVAEHRRRIGRDGGVTLTTDVRGRRKSQLGHNAPGTRERGGARGAGTCDGNRVERVGDGVEQSAVRGLTAKSQRELSDRRGTREASEILAKRRPRPCNVESRERVPIAPRLRVQMRRSLREQIEATTKPT